MIWKIGLSFTSKALSVECLKIDQVIEFYHANIKVLVFSLPPSSDNFSADKFSEKEEKCSS
jgi:hypothetical protein